ncbi:MAG: hypothetical protein ACTSRG_00290 [Candidatus Helarchaeota archaeon]
MDKKDILKKTFGKGFIRILDILDILEELKGPFTTNLIVKEMKKIDGKIRHETIKKYLELIYEISNRGILERSLEQNDNSSLGLWNFRSDKKEDARKLYNYISRNNSDKQIELEELSRHLGWSSKRVKNTIRELMHQGVVKFESKKISLEQSWLDFEEWIQRNTINPKETKILKLKQNEKSKKKNLTCPKLRQK